MIHLLLGIRLRKYHESEEQIPVAPAFEDSHRCSPSPHTSVAAELRRELPVRPGPGWRIYLAAGDSPALEQGHGRRGSSLAGAWPGGLGGLAAAEHAAGGAGPLRRQRQGLRSAPPVLEPALYGRPLREARYRLENQTYPTLPVPMRYPTSEVSGACSPPHVSRRAW